VLLAALVVGGGAGYSSTDRGRMPLLGIAGDLPRFGELTGQNSKVHQAFVGWGQGQTWGSPFLSLFATLTPIPMIHLGTDAKPPKHCEAISPARIASGAGDSYLLALNQAISQWGQAIYIRPMAEMNNAINCYAGFTAGGGAKAGHSPADYVRAFIRIYLIVHGGHASAINAILRAHGMPPIAADLPGNPFPRVRVVWSPLASDNPRVPGNAAKNYYPGTHFVDVDGVDIFDDSSPDVAPWEGFEGLYAFAGSHHKPFSIPEWGLLPDDPVFIGHVCKVLKTHHLIEEAGFYISHPPSPYDIAPKGHSREAYRGCISPLGGDLPAWAAGSHGGGGAPAAAVQPVVVFLLAGHPRPGSAAKAPGGADELEVNFDPHSYVIASAFWLAGGRPLGRVATVPLRSTGFLLVTKGAGAAAALAPPAGATGIHVVWDPTTGAIKAAAWIRVGHLLAQIPVSAGQTTIGMRGAG
jgi:hypothetical protein